MLAAIVTFSLCAAPWDGQSAVELSVGETIVLEAPRPVRFVSVGASDVVDLGVTRDLRSVQLRGLRRGTRSVVVHYQDRTRAVVELRVSAGTPARARRLSRR